MLLNEPANELHLKIAYFGPGMSGKTTNLQKIREIIGPTNTSEITSIETHYDRTLFFDYMQLKIDSIYGLNLRINLYTVPGQDFYRAIREIVILGIDGLVFVADSHVDRVEENHRSLSELKRYISAAGISFSDLPKIMQYNKQDLETALAPEMLQKELVNDDIAYYPASAINGIGVIETLKEIIMIITDKNSN